MRTSWTDIIDQGSAFRATINEIERNRNQFKLAAEAAESPLVNVVNVLERDSGFGRMLADVERHQRLIDSICSQDEFQGTQELIAEIGSRFTLPDASGIAKLVREIDLRHFARWATQGSEQVSQVQKAMEAMRTPWLDAERTLESVNRFVEIQGIGHVLEQVTAFEDYASLAFRETLGDWRDRISWPEGIATDLVARSEFYEGLGFDSDLTSFPAPAFQESVDIAGLRREPPSLIVRYGPPVPLFPPSGSEEEEALARTNQAHDWLLRLETNLRQSIDFRMTQAFGPDWPRRRLPKGLYDRWMERKQKSDTSDRGNWPLIVFADFTDYERVICKKDNWREVFYKGFQRPESVRESFQRLHMIRLDTMHSRPIGQDDELLLYVEVKRLIKAVRSLSD